MCLFTCLFMTLCVSLYDTIRLVTLCFFFVFCGQCSHSCFESWKHCQRGRLTPLVFRVVQARQRGFLTSLCVSAYVSLRHYIVVFITPSSWSFVANGPTRVSSRGSAASSSRPRRHPSSSPTPVRRWLFFSVVTWPSFSDGHLEHPITSEVRLRIGGAGGLAPVQLARYVDCK